jgi:hypothetical protein
MDYRKEVLDLKLLAMLRKLVSGTAVDAQVFKRGRSIRKTAIKNEELTLIASTLLKELEK